MASCCRFQNVIKGAPFCKCYNRKKKRQLKCTCGEEFDVHEWEWDPNAVTSAAHLSRENREVFFHPGYSSGTAAVRGNTPLVRGKYYYWEIKILTPVYGTDVMIGVGTSKVNLKELEEQFSSLLGSDKESWGYSYNAAVQHNRRAKRYGHPFVQGSIVGVFLDMYRGILRFSLNRESLGVAFSSIEADELYPMVCSTAAQSAMRVIYSVSCTPNLQLLCLQTLHNKEVLMDQFRGIPGLQSHLGEEFWWLIQPENKQVVEGKGVEIELILPRSRSMRACTSLVDVMSPDDPEIDSHPSYESIPGPSASSSADLMLYNSRIMELEHGITIRFSHPGLQRYAVIKRGKVLDLQLEKLLWG